ncbi:MULTISPECIES: MurR/RpiR family transcriptional regulator [Fusobacterium]|jgi:DNA-binding MurR/RpiR family transcriptional regulator|uniref:MurR/RpiR family transcriptional regulator n=1 Tax=Fusobacterium varium ATCC 27725 TaxID=469618 RepID=A0ABN5JJA7_FUSVA|nr:MULTISPECIES: MurR/RpiR family transcriptional regulator [Fusobacterium]AVQ31715.1 MurR/RpiR family transcriptional regulator [Fusobacterium varium ATCC 27725]EES63059.1 SIS domain protein [Fusobacterium varium ATCC 27725]MCF0171682.1 MurR/RpiR family transcriptional regulator [Fusobacterium varium]MCF2672662.1 MurR/RpiR family transcriptional regulator [Fusobacterium varium]MCI6031479.1 MurR/RpiR family transcriptional regulator [Fusobacterium varium]
MDKIHKFYKENYKTLTKGEKKIAEFLVKNPKKVILLSALDLGKEIGVSDASVLRFSKTMGFNKFNDFKNYIALELSETSPDDRIVKNWDNFNSKNDIANKIVNADLENIKEFLLNVDFDQVNEAVEMIDEAKKIYFLGIGSSRAISQFMFWHVKRLGFNAECVNEGGLGLYEAFSHIKKGDVVIIFAFPRFLNDEIKAVKLAKEKKAKIITITSNVFSEISFLSNIVFKISVENNGFFNSYIVPMELCNIILTALFEKNKTSIYAELKENSLVKDFLFTSEN